MIKKLKPVDINCLGNWCLFKGEKHILDAIYMNWSRGSGRTYRRYDCDEVYEQENVKRCPDIIYGDEDE